MNENGNNVFFNVYFKFVWIKKKVNIKYLSMINFIFGYEFYLENLLNDIW